MPTTTRYQDKRFSILGDSISTFEGYSQPEWAAYYDVAHKLEADVIVPLDTWWGQVIDRLGGTLLVNNAFSGSSVAKHPQYEIPSYGCSDERTRALDCDGISPDVIMVFMGCNDFGREMPPLPSPGREQDPGVFSVAYERMLTSLQKNYPDAELWCFTLPVSTWSQEPDFVFHRVRGGHHIEEYCRVIRACAEQVGARVIELYSEAPLYDTIDGLHPNRDGMKAVADRVLEQLTGGDEYDH